MVVLVIVELRVAGNHLYRVRISVLQFPRSGYEKPLPLTAHAFACQLPLHEFDEAFGKRIFEDAAAEGAVNIPCSNFRVELGTGAKA